MSADSGASYTSQLWGCVSVEVDVLGSPSLMISVDVKQIVLMVSVDGKQIVLMVSVDGKQIVLMVSVDGKQIVHMAVSYTHLTLPTRRGV